MIKVARISLVVSVSFVIWLNGCILLVAVAQAQMIEDSHVLALLQGLSSSTVEKRRMSAVDLGTNVRKKDVVPVVTALVSALRDPSVEVRIAVINALGNLGSDAFVAQTQLANRLNHGLPEERSSAARALAEVAAEPRYAIPIFVRALQDPEIGVRVNAAGALGKFGTDPDAFSALIVATKDSNKSVRFNACGSLQSVGFGSPQLVGILLGLLSDNDSGVRTSALIGLSHLKSESRAITEAIAVRLEDEDPMVRKMAKNALQVLNR